MDQVSVAKKLLRSPTTAESRLTRRACARTVLAKEEPYRGRRSLSRRRRCSRASLGRHIGAGLRPVSRRCRQGRRASAPSLDVQRGQPKCARTSRSSLACRRNTTSRRRSARWICRGRGAAGYRSPEEDRQARCKVIRPAALPSNASDTQESLKSPPAKRRSKPTAWTPRNGTRAATGEGRRERRAPLEPSAR